MDFLRLENTTFSREYVLTIHEKLFTIDETQVMGIVNCTPDSFYKGSQSTDFEQQKNKIDEHIQAGASWIDLGAQSTRPGAELVSAEAEMERLNRSLDYLLECYPTVKISVDTFYTSVADKVLTRGAHLINDISGGLHDPEMFATVGLHRAPYVLMHTRGTAQTMQQLTDYDDVLKSVIVEMGQQMELARAAGVNDIIIDPGFGFAKTTAQNFILLKNLAVFQLFNCPILVGTSRKSMIYKTLQTSPEEALNGTTALNAFALTKGASFLRVHDVKEAVETSKLLKLLL